MNSEFKKISFFCRKSSKIKTPIYFSLVSEEKFSLFVCSPASDEILLLFYELKIFFTFFINTTINDRFFKHVVLFDCASQNVLPYFYVIYIL